MNTATQPNEITGTPSNVDFTTNLVRGGVNFKF